MNAIDKLIEKWDERQKFVFRHGSSDTIDCFLADLRALKEKGIEGCVEPTPTINGYVFFLGEKRYDGKPAVLFIDD